MEENQVHQIHIPQGWFEDIVLELCHIGRGRVISQKEITENIGEYPVYSSQTQNNGEMGRIDTFDFEGDYITWTTDGANAGTVFYRTGRFNCTNVCGTLQEKDKNIDLKFLAYKLSTVAKKHVSYIGNPKLMNGTMSKVSLVIPKSKTEQTQIATILSKVDEAITQTEQLIAKYTRIKTGLMQDLLTKGIDENGNIRSEETHEFKDSPLGRIPKEWECVLFDEIISNFDSGWSPNCESRQASFGEWGSLKTTSITWAGYNSSENKKLPDNLIPRKRLEVSFDDILITRVGPRERVGVVVHVNDMRSKLMLSDNMLRVKLNKTRELYYPFIPLMLGSEVIQKELKNKIAGLAEAQVVINQQSIKSTYILLPNKIEQEDIFNKVQNYKAIIDIENLKLSKLQSLKTGLMQDLLSGKVRVNHLIKETANV